MIFNPNARDRCLSILKFLNEKKTAFLLPSHCLFIAFYCLLALRPTHKTRHHKAFHTIFSRQTIFSK